VRIGELLEHLQRRARRRPVAIDQEDLLFGADPPRASLEPAFAQHTLRRRVAGTEKRDDFVRCLSEKMLTYALGRGLEYYDKCAVEQITKRLAKNKYRFSSLMLEVIKSTPFQMHRGEEQQLTQASP